VAAAYVLGLAGAASDDIWLLATRNLGAAYVLANFIAEYVFILLALGVIGQLIWLSRRKPPTND
jgi:lipoprotein signal peptidase